MEIHAFWHVNTLQHCILISWAYFLIYWQRAIVREKHEYTYSPVILIWKDSSSILLSVRKHWRVLWKMLSAKRTGAAKLLCLGCPSWMKKNLTTELVRFQCNGYKPRIETTRVRTKKSTDSIRSVKITVSSSIIVDQILANVKKLRQVENFKTVFVTIGNILNIYLNNIRVHPKTKNWVINYVIYHSP